MAIELFRRHLIRGTNGEDDALDVIDDLLPGTSRSDRTRRNNRAGIRVYLRWAREHHRSVLHPDPATGTDYVTWLNARYAPSTVNNRVTHARNAYAALRRLGHHGLDPFADVQTVRYHPEDHRDWFTRQEIDRLVSNTDVEGRVMVLLGAHAGLTGPEAVALTWQDIRVTPDGHLSVRRRLVEQPEALLNALQTLAQARGLPHDVRGATLGITEVHANEPVLSPTDEHALRSALYRVCSNANVEVRAKGARVGRGWRALRNAAGLRLVHLTGDPDLVAERLGVGTRLAVEPLVRLAQRLEHPGLGTGWRGLGNG